MGRTSSTTPMNEIMPQGPAKKMMVVEGAVDGYDEMVEPAACPSCRSLAWQDSSISERCSSCSVISQTPSTAVLETITEEGDEEVEETLTCLSAEELVILAPQFKLILYPHLLHGYRTPKASLRASLASIFEYHNETVNIWTHLFGVFWFLGLTVYSYHNFQGTSESLAVLCTYLLCTVSTMLMSTIYHTMNSHSGEVCRHCHSIDWAFVAVMIGGCNILGTFSELFCFPQLRAIMVFLVLALTVYVFQSNYHMVQGWYNAHEAKASSTAPEPIENPGDYLWANLLCMLFTSMAVTSWVLHRVIIGGPNLASSMTLGGMITAYAIVLAGGILNCLGIPERFIQDRPNHHVRR